MAPKLRLQLPDIATSSVVSLPLLYLLRATRGKTSVVLVCYGDNILEPIHIFMHFHYYHI